MRVKAGQEFVIGGYTVGTSTFDALVFGYCEGDKLIDAAKTRNGFSPASRAAGFKLEIRTAGLRTCLKRRAGGGELV